MASIAFLTDHTFVPENKMRIMLFPKLITDEETQKCSLKNCSVVLDGQNFFHYLYEKSRIPFVFGSETNEYARYLRRKLHMFKQANVKCYIVFKGGDSVIEDKIKKFQSLIYDFDTHLDYVPPIIIKVANVQTIEEMGIDHAYCVMESKDECVALAQKLGCPLISFDIEYCFRKAAYIPHVTMQFNETTNTIHCGQYKLENFLKKHSLTEEKLAIFATLSDTNIFPLEFFDALFNTWGVSNKNLYIKHKNLIGWLSKHSEQEARDGITHAVSENDLTKFWSNYDKILNTMRKDVAGLTTEYLVNNSKLTIARQDPEWFEKGVVSKHISPIYVNLYKWKTIEGSWVVEDKSSQDSLFLSIDIIKYAYNLLTNYRKDTIKLYQDADNYLEVDTEDPNVQRPSYNCKFSVFENGWDQVKRLKLFEHFVKENKVNMELLVNLPSDAAVLFIALVYFARKKQLDNEDVTKEMYAAILSYVMLNYVFDREGSYKKNIHHLKEKDCLQAKIVTEQYFNYIESEAKQIYDGNVLKRFVEFQYCLKHINYLNILCGSTYKSTWFIRMYHGTFIYKIFWDMHSKNIDADVFVNKLFENAPSILEFVKPLLQVYKDLLEEV